MLTVSSTASLVLLMWWYSTVGTLFFFILHVSLLCAELTAHNYTIYTYNVCFEPIPGVPYALAKLAICYCILPSLWLLVPGLSSHLCHCFLYNLLLRSALVSNIFGNGYKILYTSGIPDIPLAIKTRQGLIQDYRLLVLQEGKIRQVLPVLYYYSPCTL